MSVGVVLGGAGGDGGSSNTVAVESMGNISTSGFRSYGILAQAVGGGGGDGGNSVAGSLYLSTDITVGVAVGGKGGVAGGGAAVDVDSDSRIKTEGDFSHGILAQSIGGGGGAGGNSSVLTEIWDFPTGLSFEYLLSMSPSLSLTMSLGGEGGTGASGGLVDVLSTGDISTKGDFAHGILAQSIGGGGGDGGNSTEISREFSINPLPGLGVQADILIGGFAPASGGAGTVNNGGQVMVHNDATIATEGAFANGILAQSIGGGGGAGGDTTKSTMDVSADFVGAILPMDASLSVSLGGWGGMGGAGGHVIVENDGDIMTAGHFANGILAQSVGGGGGAGGASTKFAIEMGLVPPGGFLSDVGGSAELSVGGLGGLGGAGGLVTIDNSGSITTAGHFANGILAQSIGGGGGAGGGIMSIDVTILGETLPPPGFDSSLSLGGYGGLGGAGGVVSVGNRGDIATAGDFATGISAQSIGGGGGTNGSVTTYSLALAGGEPSAKSLKGASAGTGHGGAVSVDNSADIVTQGGFAHGILAQSIGGGGGFGGISEDGGISTLDFDPTANGIFAENTGFGVGFAGSAGGWGSAGAVNVTHTGSITTLGDMSHGILAQSAAGSGTAGPVTVTLASDITANGMNSDGIHAQSVGIGGNGDISINIGGGTVRGGSGTGAGVNIDGGANNTLTNAGSVLALSGKAIMAGIGNDIVENYGTVTGNVDLGTGANAFNNNPGATFNSGAIVNLGEGNVLTNAGTLSPGGLGTALQTTLMGDLAQLESGILDIEIGGFTPGLSDFIDITGTVTGGMAAIGTPLVMGGAINFSFLSGYDIAAEIALGQSMTCQFLNAGYLDGFASTLSYDFLGSPWGFQYSVFQQDNGLFLRATNSIPAPGALLLGCFGLALVGWRGRRARPWITERS
ncbi:MAG: hypothetical protein JW741_18125 [Sedimentisphaerales bacterium]|nr:hypothetical protein [Sedimentisphaerales bacterium]